MKAEELVNRKIAVFFGASLDSNVAKKSDEIIGGESDWPETPNEAASPSETPTQPAVASPSAGCLPLNSKAKKRAKEREKAEQTEAYRKYLTAIAMQNAGRLAAYASQITGYVPSATEAVKSVLAIYARSAVK